MTINKKQVKHRLSEIEKIQLVKDFFNTNINKTSFSKLHNIDRKALSRWIDKYGDVAKNEIDTLIQEDISKSSDTDMTVSISYFEYLELLKIKHKYEVMHSVLDA